MRHIASIALLSALACDGEPVPETFPLEVSASADRVPLDGVRITAGALELGTTAQGLPVAVAYPGREGEILSLRASCPAGYEAEREAVSLTLRRVASLEGQGARPLRVEMRCRPLERTAMLLVRSAGERDLPVWIDGLEVARTDADGLAHVALRYPPYTRIDVVLRTDHLPDVSPRNPPRTFVLPDADEVFVFDQPLARARAPQIVRARRIVRIPRRVE